MKAEEIFLAAVEKPSPTERAACLDEVCGDDAGLRRWVEGLLRSHEQGGSFLEGPLFEPRPTIDETSQTERPGLRVGPYKLLEQIGEGGMGVVYMAEQTQPVRRKVALKLIRSRAEVVRRTLETRHHRYAADIRQAHQLAQDGQGPKALELLRKYRPAQGEEDIREFAWRYVMRLCHGERLSLTGHDGAVYHADYSPDGRTPVSCGEEGTVRLWDATTNEELLTLRWSPGGMLSQPRFSPDGRTLAFCAQGADGSWLYLLPTALPGGLDDVGQAFQPDADRTGPRRAPKPALRDGLDDAT